jgi:hypothetical protein
MARCVKNRDPVRQLRIRLDLRHKLQGLEGPRGGAKLGRDLGEGPKIIIDQRLPGYPENLAVGRKFERLGGFVHGAAFEFSKLVDDFEIRRLAQ